MVLVGGWSPVEASLAIGPGLLNLGNTCFLNAVLQCLTHTVPLVRALQTSPHPSPCPEHGGAVPGAEGMFCFVCAMKQHLEVCFYMMGTVVAPYGFVRNLNKMSSSFCRYQQEDAHEFLNCLLDCLHTSCLDPQSRDGPSSFQGDSFIKQIFGGRLRSQVKCCHCGRRSDTFEPLLDLSLEIEEAVSLGEALESFTHVEKIEDPDVLFTCGGCNNRVCVLKQFTVDKPPPVVAFHLKRFKSHGCFADKIGKFVEYPLELDLRPFLSAPDQVDHLKYELYAVLVHEGCFSMFGHYYCFVRPSPDVWYMMDDETVVRTDEQVALRQSAYILFYTKQGTPWFSSLVEEQQRLRADANGVSRASPPSILGGAEESQVSSSESEDNSKMAKQSPNKDERVSLSDGASFDAGVLSQAWRMDWVDLMRASPGPDPANSSDDAPVDADECDSSATDGSRPDSASNDQNAASPSRPIPRQLYIRPFHEETSDADEKEKLNFPKLHLHGEKVGGCGNNKYGDDDGEQAEAPLGHWRPTARSRRNRFQRHPTRRSANPKPWRRQGKWRLDAEPALPCHSSPMLSVRQVSSDPPLPTPVSHDLLLASGAPGDSTEDSCCCDEKTD